MAVSLENPRKYQFPRVFVFPTGDSLISKFPLPFKGINDKSWGLGINLSQTVQKVFFVSYSSKLSSECFDFGIE